MPEKRISTSERFARSENTLHAPMPPRSATFRPSACTIDASQREALVMPSSSPEPNTVRRDCRLVVGRKRQTTPTPPASPPELSFSFARWSGDWHCQVELREPEPGEGLEREAAAAEILAPAPADVGIAEIRLVAKLDCGIERLAAEDDRRLASVKLLRVLDPAHTGEVDFDRVASRQARRCFGPGGGDVEAQAGGRKKEAAIFAFDPNFVGATGSQDKTQQHAKAQDHRGLRTPKTKRLATTIVAARK
jgi:hypothetical protein